MGTLRLRHAFLVVALLHLGCDQGEFPADGGRADGGASTVEGAGLCSDSEPFCSIADAQPDCPPQDPVPGTPCALELDAGGRPHCTYCVNHPTDPRDQVTATCVDGIWETSRASCDPPRDGGA